ncbi:phage holin family protein [Teichococcus aestuarii]|uniref:phage holin family protein n=1 Tax=Teichococcus aestuarii TaxID=568898 RepID=UPI00361EE062
MAIFEPPSGWDVAGSLAAAAAGRALLLLSAPREGVTARSALRTLLWEVPVTAAIGFLGYGLARWLALDGGAAIVLIALLARFGPDRLEPLLEVLVPALRRTKP